MCFLFFFFFSLLLQGNGMQITFLLYYRTLSKQFFRQSSHLYILVQLYVLFKTQLQTSFLRLLRIKLVVFPLKFKKSDYMRGLILFKLFFFQSTCTSKVHSFMLYILSCCSPSSLQYSLYILYWYILALYILNSYFSILNSCSLNLTSMGYNSNNRILSVMRNGL